MNIPREDSLLWVGRIVKTQGIKGEVRIFSGGGDFHNFSEGKVVYVKDQKGGKRAFLVESFRPRGSMTVLSLRGVKGIEEAEKLVGSSVYVDKKDLDLLPSDEFYWHQLRGLRVETEDGRFLGRLEKILPTGSNDVFVVGKGETEVLIPATDEVVVRVDLKEGVMFVHLLEGLLPEDDL